MWKREGYCQGGVSSTPGAGGRGPPGSRSHISGRERPALPPCSLKLASLPRPPGSACRLLIPDASLDHVPPCPLPHSRLPPAPFSPLYSRVAPRGDQGSSRSPPRRSEVRGRPRTPPAPRLRSQPRPRSPAWSRGARSKPGGAGRGGRTEGPPRLGTPLPKPSAPCALGGRGAGTAILLPAEPFLRRSLAGRPGRRCGDIARGRGALPEPQGEQTAPVTPFRSGCRAAAEAGGRSRRRRPSLEQGELRRALESRRGLRAAPRGAPRAWQRAVSRGRRRGTASELVPAVSAAYITSGKEEEEEKSIKSVN